MTNKLLSTQLKATGLKALSSKATHTLPFYTLMMVIKLYIKIECNFKIKLWPSSRHNYPMIMYTEWYSFIFCDFLADYILALTGLGLFNHPIYQYPRSNNPPYVVYNSLPPEDFQLGDSVPQPQKEQLQGEISNNDDTAPRRYKPGKLFQFNRQ